MKKSGLRREVQLLTHRNDKHMLYIPTRSVTFELTHDLHTSEQRMAITCKCPGQRYEWGVKEYEHYLFSSAEEVFVSFRWMRPRHVHVETKKNFTWKACRLR